LIETEKNRGQPQAMPAGLFRLEFTKIIGLSELSRKEG
jgi:hypothetical protein